MTTVPIVHCFDRNYVVPAAVAFHSLLEHAKSPDTMYVLHVIGRNLTDSDKELLLQVVSRFKNAKLEFHNPPDIDLKFNGRGNFSIDMFYKLSLPDVLTDDMVLVADVDVVYEGDVADLYHEMRADEKYWLCGTADVGYATWRGEGILRDAGELKFFKRYIRSMSEVDRKKLLMGAGFFAMNLKLCRIEGASKKWLEFAKAHLDRLVLPEQDVLNICSHGKIKIVSSRYMAIAAYFPEYEKKDAEERKSNPAWDEMYANPVQIHYASGIKPWKFPGSPLAGKWFDACVAAGMIHGWRSWYAKLMAENTRFLLARKIVNWSVKIGRRSFKIVIAREKGSHLH